MITRTEYSTPVANSGLVRLQKILLAVLVVGIVLTAATLGLAAATLATVRDRLPETDNTNNPITTTGTASTTRITTPMTVTMLATTTASTPTTSTSTTTTTAITSGSLGAQLAESLAINEVMTHLKELQRIAMTTGGSRAVNTVGFNQTLDYISSQLRTYTNYNIQRSYFYLRNFVIGANPTFSTEINGVVQDRNFSSTTAQAEFFYAQYTRPYTSSTFRPITVIPNVGCQEADWQAASPAPAGQIALVKRGDCTFADKAAFAAQYNVALLLFYNDGTAPDRFAPIFVSLGTANELPALFLSYNLGQELANAAANPSSNLGVRINIYVADESVYPVGNICADTPTGDATQTIVIGSHSDSVPAGPGINDNGSGSAANLGLAIALARLFEKPDYAKYAYRVRFCWWGAEEIGLLGSADHVRKAKNATAVGERLQDYLINLNYDMLGSPNFIFGIYDGRTARNDTPTLALAGSNRITALFKDWFVGQKLPWTYTDFSGRSDYGPFLAEGIVAGGLFSGADERKTMEQRDYYDEMLGQGLGGIAGAIQDPCYHQACDSIQNINILAFEKMVQAAAYALEYLGKQSNLKLWLYPSREAQRESDVTRSQRPYNSINSYFGLPDL